MIFSGAWAWVRGSDTDKLGDRQCQRLQPHRYLFPARPHARQPQHPELIQLIQPGSCLWTSLFGGQIRKQTITVQWGRGGAGGPRA